MIILGRGVLGQVGFELRGKKLEFEILGAGVFWDRSVLNSEEKVRVRNLGEGRSFLGQVRLELEGGYSGTGRILTQREKLILGGRSVLDLITE